MDPAVRRLVRLLGGARTADRDALAARLQVAAGARGGRDGRREGGTEGRRNG